MYDILIMIMSSSINSYRYSLTSFNNRRPPFLYYDWMPEENNWFYNICRDGFYLGLIKDGESELKVVNIGKDYKYLYVLCTLCTVHCSRVIALKFESVGLCIVLNYGYLLLKHSFVLPQWLKLLFNLSVVDTVDEDCYEVNKF